MNASEEIRKAVKLLYEPGDTVEVRAFGPGNVKRVGRFTLGWDLVKAIAAEDESGSDVYYVLNPTSLPLQPMTDGGLGTREENVPRRRHFLLDFDPVRKNKLATDEQYAKAKAAAVSAVGIIGAPLGVLPVIASSGNGYHLLVPVDFPNDPEHKAIIQLFQKSISQRFSTPEVIVECFPDAARLVRAYGTLNKKGDQTAELRWRRSHIL